MFRLVPDLPLLAEFGVLQFRSVANVFHICNWCVTSLIVSVKSSKPTIFYYKVGQLV